MCPPHVLNSRGATDLSVVLAGVAEVSVRRQERTICRKSGQFVAKKGQILE